MVKRYRGGIHDQDRSVLVPRAPRVGLNTAPHFQNQRKQRMHWLLVECQISQSEPETSSSFSLFSLHRVKKKNKYPAGDLGIILSSLIDVHRLRVILHRDLPKVFSEPDLILEGGSPRERRPKTEESEVWEHPGKDPGCHGPSEDERGLRTPRISSPVASINSGLLQGLSLPSGGGAGHEGCRDKKTLP